MGILFAYSFYKYDAARKASDMILNERRYSFRSASFIFPRCASMSSLHLEETYCAAHLHKAPRTKLTTSRDARIVDGESLLAVYVRSVMKLTAMGECTRTKPMSDDSASR